MATQIDTAQREIVLVEDAHVRPMMGQSVLEPLPSRHIPYSLVDPYILVHEAAVRISPEMAGLDTTHPHRGFDNLWYAVSGASSTGHSTGPGGTMERARLEAGSLLKLRTGRGILHAEGIGKDELEEGKAGTDKSDTEKVVIKMYDVRGPLGFGVRRGTYLVDQARHIRSAVLADFRISAHEEFVRKAIALSAES